MAFQTGTSSSIENLMTQLSTFLQANGWTQDFFTSGDPGRIGLHKNNIYVAFQWTEATDGGVLAVYQNLSNDNSSSVWLSTGDSGQGVASLTASLFDSSRHINLFAGPHTGYYFFENDASPAYCHVVVEVDAGLFRHFGFGEIDKIGDWIGGEYCYCQYWAQATTQLDDPANGAHAMCLDGRSDANISLQSTMHVEGYQNEPEAATQWAITGRGSQTVGNGGTDRAGNIRWIAAGGWRYSREFLALHGFRISLFNAYKPLVPMPIELLDVSSTPEVVFRVGYQADVRMCNIANIDPGQIINIAGDNWYFFPWVRKQFLQNNTDESWDAGVAYKRIDA